MSNRKYVKYQGIKFYRHPFSEEYLASKCGKILSLKWNKKRILKLHKLRNNYLNFKLCENNIHKEYSVHRFVYECFKGTIPKGMEIDHCDFDRKNNTISNLQLLNHKENVRKSICKKVISFNIETQEEKIFDSIKEAGEYYKIDSSSISAICKKKMKTSKSKKDGKRYQFFYL